MGGEVARTYVLSHGNGAGFHVRNPLGRLSEGWFAALDVALAIAAELGVRLIIPFVNTAYYPLWGTSAMYAEWLGEGESPNAFFTSPAQRALFKTVITRILTRVNTLTGTAYASDPAILAWELGNELVDPGHSRYRARSARPPDAWTEEMAAHVKLLAPSTLVMDGGFFAPSALALSNIDLLGSTYYNVKAAASLGADLAGAPRSPPPPLLLSRWLASVHGVRITMPFPCPRMPAAHSHVLCARMSPPSWPPLSIPSRHRRRHARVSRCRRWQLQGLPCQGVRPRLCQRRQPHDHGVPEHDVRG